MPSSKTSAIFPFLTVLFLAAVCNAMIIPFMGFFLVESLGYEPWVITVYTGMAVLVTLVVNRTFGERIDSGEKVFPLIGIAAIGSLIASFSLALSPKLWTVLSLGVLGFGISSSAISTLFSLGGSLAERNAITREQINAYMRATTSTAWMLGPAITFLMADQIHTHSVFQTAFVLSLLWIGLWWLVLPHGVTTANTKSQNKKSIGTEIQSRGLWLAAAFVFCLSSAHSLTFTALPLFFVQEVGLPGYAPGIAFSMKTLIEVIVVFSTPAIVARFGMRSSLMVTTLIAVGTIQFLTSINSFPQMIIGAAFEGLYYGLYSSIGISYVQSFAPTRPGRATAIYWNTLLVTGLIAGPAVGLIAQASNFQLAIQIAVGCAICAAIVLMFSTKEKPKPAG